MHIGIIIFLVIIIAIFALLRGKSENEKTDNENDKKETEKVFFENIENGEKAFKIMTIYSQIDLMFMKSLFQLEQIPYYVEFECNSTIYPGTYIDSFSNTNIYILEKDYNDVIKIIEDYKNKKNMENDIDGIEINYRKNND